MLAKCSGFNPTGPYLEKVSSLEKENETFLCCVHLLRKAVPRNEKFHVAVVQRNELRNVQKKRDARAKVLFC